MQRILTLWRFDMRLALRNGESLLLLLVIPVLLLAFFGQVDVLPTGDDADDPVDFLTPGVLALGVLSASFVNLAISVGFDRHYGVLKRLGASPLGRGELVVAKVLLVGGLVTLQWGVLIAVAAASGWTPGAGLGVSALAAALASVSFVALALTLAGRLPGLMVLAVANGLYVVVLLLSGMVIAFDELPAALAAVGRALPSGALASILRDALGDGVWGPGWAWVVLGAWALTAPAIAVRAFRWQPDD